MPILACWAEMETVARDGKEKHLLRDGGEQGAQPAGAFTPLRNGTAAGTPSVSATDSADLFLIPVSLSLGGGRWYCHDSVLSQGSSPEEQGNSWIQRCINAPWASA